MVKYIVCNSETAVLNRMYDEFGKNLGGWSGNKFHPEHIINTQFTTNRMIDDNKMGKYSYKHVINVRTKGVCRHRHRKKKLWFISFYSSWIIEEIRCRHEKCILSRVSR